MQLNTPAPAEAARAADGWLPSGTRRLTADIEVLDPQAQRQHRQLTVIAVAAILAFGVMWIAVVGRGEALVASAVVSVALAVAIGAWLLRWLSLARMRRPVHAPPVAGLRVAAVTTFVASKEPIDMLERTLVAMRDMDYPHDTWVLDEEDSPAVRALCSRLRVRHHSRSRHPEFQAPAGPFARASKHGNYNAWCEAIGFERYDVLAAFDPDHVPAPHYLERTLGFLAADRVAYVQTPQFYYNQGVSFVARGAAEESYGYYSTHLMASYGMGHTVVIGSHGVHRLSALESVGGFPAHDAEDLYLTIVYGAERWRGVYVPEVLVMGMTPVDWAGYLKQQARWARSLLDVKLHVLPRLSGQLPLAKRMLNLLHGAGFLRPLLVPCVLAGILLLLLTNAPVPFLSLEAVANAGSLFVILSGISRFQQRYYLDPSRESGVPWRSAVLQVAKWPVFMRAVADVLARRRVAYAVTVKRTASHREWKVLPVQLGAAALVAAAWSIGVVRHGDLRTALDALAVVTVLLSLGIAASEVMPAAESYSAGLYDARYREMSLAGADEGR